jgi:hypothetical protein
VDALTEIHGCVEEGQPLDLAPEVKLIPACPTGKASKGVGGQICGKGTALRRRRAMDRAWTAKLIAVPSDRLEGEELQHLRHGEPVFWMYS